MKTVLFIPGFQEDIGSRPYSRTIKAIESKGYKVKFVSINWTRTTIEQWVPEFEKVYAHYRADDTIFAGFSYGAMIAFLAATDRNPSEVWLFSLSPYFNEDMKDPSFKKSWLTHIGHRRVDSFKKLSFTKLVESIKTPTTYFYGELELKTFPDISYRKKALKDKQNATEVYIPGGKHDVTSPEYVEAIKTSL